MLQSDANKIVAAFEQRFGTGQALSVEVRREVTQPKVTAPGAGRPAFIDYRIRISDGTRVADLDQQHATALLDEVSPDWTADRVFDAIRSRDVPVEQAN